MVLKIRKRWRSSSEKQDVFKEERPMTEGRFGPFGGQYIPETLMNEIHRLEKAYNFYKHNADF